jgi:hypothetical protein
MSNIAIVYVVIGNDLTKQEELILPDYYLNSKRVGFYTVSRW